MSSAMVVFRMPSERTADSISASNFDRLLLTSVMLLLSGLFFLSDDHRYGIPFLMEGVAAVSLLFFAYYAVFHRERMERVDWYVAFLALMVFIVPVFFSYLYFKQPFEFGILEERRTLLYFSYFIPLLMLRKKSYSTEDIESVLGVVFVVGLIWSALNAYELIPRNQGFSFSTHTEHFAEGFQSMDDRFATRFLGGNFMIFLYVYFLLAQGKFGKALLPVILTVLYMVFINQTRSIAAIAIISMLAIVVIRLKKDHLNLAALFFVPIFMMLLYFLYFLYAYVFAEPVFFYDVYRNMEFNLLFRDVIRDFFMPHGHLSLQFNGGFKTYFGMNVYTADMGLVGYLYKYGFFYIPLIAIYVAVVGMLYRRYHNDFIIIMMAIFIAVCLTIPFGEHISRMAGEFAILMTLIRIQGDVYGQKTVKYIARVRRGGASRPSHTADGANAFA